MNLRQQRSTHSFFHLLSISVRKFKKERQNNCELEANEKMFMFFHVQNCL